MIGITTATASLLLLAVALKGLPLGTAYTVWEGIGAAGVTTAGILLMGESASPGRLVFLR